MIFDRHRIQNEMKTSQRRIFTQEKEGTGNGKSPTTVALSGMNKAALTNIILL